eukprot:jgi/Mesen1/8789/ME000527S08290
MSQFGYDPSQKQSSFLPDSGFLKDRISNFKNRLLVGMFIHQTRASTSSCDHKRFANIDDTCLSTSPSLEPYGVDPVFLETSSMFDPTLNAKDFYPDPSLFTANNVPLGFFHRKIKGYPDGFSVIFDINLSHDQAVARLQYLEDGLFLIMLRVLKYLDFQPRMGIITRSLGAAGPELMSFFLLLAIIFVIYSLQAHLVFGRSIDAVNGDLLLLQGWELAAGQIFFWTFIVFVTFILMNFLIAIVVDAFVEAKGILEKMQGTLDSVNEQLMELRGSHAVLDMRLKAVERGGSSSFSIALPQPASPPAPPGASEIGPNSSARRT